MRRIYPLGFILVALQFSGPMVRAENSIDVLEQDLKDAQQQHEDASSRQFSDFISALDKALQSPDEALALYQNAGGDMPDPAPVLTIHDSETPNEKALREAQDAAVNASLVSVIQIHCGLMRFAAFFIQSPDEKGLHDAWIAWLKQAAQSYPQAGITPPDTRVKPLTPDDQRNQHEGENANGQGVAPRKPKKIPAPLDYVKALKDKAVRDSVISAYLGYNAWGDKEQGTWAVRDIPRFYRAEILDPLRVNPSAATLSAWDAYIAMKSADEPDRDKWNNVDYPAFQFQRDKDDFYAEPSDEKLETLVTLVKNNPVDPDLDNWITQVKQMIQDYRTFKSTGRLPPPVDDSTNFPSAARGASTSTPAPAPTPTPVPAHAGT